MKNQLKMRENEFKLMILHQLKNPRLPFNHLLSKEEFNVRKGATRSNFARKDFLMHASEFDMDILFSWDEDIKHDNSGLLFPYADGGHHVLFGVNRGKDVPLVDLTNNKLLQGLNIKEETVLFSSIKNPNVLSFGIRSFYVEEEDYFFTEVSKEGRGEEKNVLNFDLETLTFDIDYYDAVSDWSFRCDEISIRDNGIYLEYLHDDDKHNFLIHHLSSLNIDERIVKGVESIFRDTPWTGRQKVTRMGNLVHALHSFSLKEKKRQREESQ